MHETEIRQEFGKTPWDKLISEITLTSIITPTQEALLVGFLLDKSIVKSHRNLILTAVKSAKIINPALSPIVDRILSKTSLSARIRGTLDRTAQVFPFASH